MTEPESPPETPDAALLAAHVAGDADAFGLLFARHRDRLWAVALRTTGDPDDAADALQDAMISAFRRAETFRGQSSVTTWLHRIVVNACLDRLRHLKSRRTDALPDDAERLAVASAAGDSPARGVDPAEAAVLGDERAAVLAALAALPPDYRAALVLVDMEGYPIAEAAQILGCPTGTVKSRCSRGRAKLRELLGNQGSRRVDEVVPLTRGNLSGVGLVPSQSDTPQSDTPQADTPQADTESPEGEAP